ncbi:general secretion pathway protein GspB [Vibrio sp. Isolate31]|uniref:general secretion pathway protein GspB n=1 Tax=unclassified Vibrio TaxID=2614977 RepID=UPI001EFD3D39|nr:MULTISPECIES: general secretion pathway protein GspB [unclassified Vibrio]MCG9552332.1 general secretion pathway protein GspB [Vibrio sp. Isolate32]MCG9600771.1 general secretion pathway protein GspB [Vibrio sp. Isolate31]
MSRIMHELNQSSDKSSFKGYQNHQVPSSAKGISNKRGSSLAMGLLVLLVPSLLVGGALVYQSYYQQQTANQAAISSSSESETQPVQAKDIETADLNVEEEVEDEPLFVVRPAPTRKTLKSLPRQEVYALVNSDSTNFSAGVTVPVVTAESTARTVDDSELSLAEPEVGPDVNDESNYQQSDSDLLQGLDLTELPPDLALKLEAIMDEQPRAPEPMDSRPASQMDPQVIELENHVNSLSGVLPKLDLQTHMYSSSENKRWVKVNGQEVSQGDWIGNDVQLLEIKPQSVVVEFNQQKIEIPALYEWKG